VVAAPGFVDVLPGRVAPLAARPDFPDEQFVGLAGGLGVCHKRDWKWVWYWEMEGFFGWVGKNSKPQHCTAYKTAIFANYICKRTNLTVLQKVVAMLPEMSPSEKAQLLQWIVSDLTNIFPGIEKTPGVCGGDACIAGTRIPVWSLVNSRNLGFTDGQLLDSYPTLSREDLKNVWNYYQANKAETDELIAENAVHE